MSVMGSLKDIFNLFPEESIMFCASQLSGIQNICDQIFEFDENRELNILTARDNILIGCFCHSDYVLREEKFQEPQQVGGWAGGAGAHCS